MRRGKLKGWLRALADALCEAVDATSRNDKSAVEQYEALAQYFTHQASLVRQAVQDEG